MTALELKIPPVIVFLVGALSVYITRNIWPIGVLPNTYAVNAAYILSVMAVLLGISAIITFKLSNTTVNPVNIDKASSLVSHGIFKYTRNPMYLAMLLVLVSLTLRWQNAVGVVAVIIFVIFMNRFQIVPEEKMLSKLFGDAYIDYKKRVRRWI